MLYGLYLSAAGLAGNRLRQDVLANNLANADTPGFKADLAVFMQRVPAWRNFGGGFGYRIAALNAATGGLFAGPTATDFSPAPSDRTKRNLDIAINGPGFLAVRDGGRTRYTRDGRLDIRDGVLVRKCDGKAVLDDQGRPIHLGDVEPQQVKIDNQCMIWVNEEQVGKIGVVQFDDLHLLRKVGDNLFDAPADKAYPSATGVVSGHLEQSGVDGARSLVEMIEAARSYEINARMISLQDETVGRLINRIAAIT